MCGIAGYISKRKTGQFDIVSSMNQLQRHRGPDDSGVVLFDENNSPFVFGEIPGSSNVPYLNFDSEKVESTVALGHVRLSILDLSELGHCPMSSQDGRFWITYNGEVYNYIEIRNELKNLGYEFLSNSDTEVVLKAYIEWGIECVNKFNGMWAFVIFDRKKNLLWGSRDRVGVKPFYYLLDDEKMLFASEQKAIVRSGLYKKEINQKAVFDYLAFTNIELEQEGFFKGILELEPGYNFSLNLNSWEFHREQYFNIHDIEQINISEREAIEKIEHLLEQSVKLRLRSDVKIGACLSGGIDSSVIVGLINKLGNNNLETFTSTTKEPEFDESSWAKHVSEYNNTHWHSIAPNADGLLENIEELSYCQDIPLFSTSTYAQWSVMKLVKENGIKVVMDGQGGDELFAGYMPYYINHWMGFLKKGKFSTLMSEMSKVESLPSGAKFFFKQYFRHYGLNKLPSKVQELIFKKFYPDVNYIAPDIYHQYRQNGFTISNSNLPTDLNGVLKYEFYNTRLKQYLKCEDRCSMWHSVEARTPFSDDIELINFLFSIKGEMKIKEGVSKYLLRESAKRVLPEKVYNRKDKMGYVTPNNKWISELRSDLKSYFTKDLEAFVNYEELMKDYDMFFNNPNQIENQRMYKYIALAVWYKVYFKS